MIKKKPIKKQWNSFNLQIVNWQTFEKILNKDKQENKTTENKLNLRIKVCKLKRKKNEYQQMRMHCKKKKKKTSK